MGSLSESGIIVALDGNGVTFKPKIGSVRHTTDRPNHIELSQRIVKAREGIERGKLNRQDLEERMRWVLNLSYNPFRDHWQLYSKKDLDQLHDPLDVRVPLLGADIPVAWGGRFGREYAQNKVKKYFNNFELDQDMVIEIKGLAEAGFPPLLFTGIQQFAVWGIREMLDPVWPYLNSEVAVALTPNHEKTGAEVKSTLTGIASAAYDVIGKDDDPYVKAKLRRYAKMLFSPLSLDKENEVAAESYPHFQDFFMSDLQDVQFDARGGEILDYLCNRN